MDLNSIYQAEVLEKISRHCPQAMSPYLQCFYKVDSEGNAYFSREDIEVRMSYDYPDFLHAIKQLAREDLLKWSPLDGGIAIQLDMEPFI